MADRENRPPLVPGKARSPTSAQPPGPSSLPFGGRPEIGKYSAWEFFDHKVVPKDETDYRQFLERDSEGQIILAFAKTEAIWGVEQDYAAAPSTDPVYLERPQPMFFQSPSRPPWSRDIGAHQIRLGVKYTVEVKDGEHLFHITMYMTVRPLDRKRSKFRGQTIEHTFEHRSTGGVPEAPKKYKAGDGVDNLYRG